MIGLRTRIAVLVSLACFAAGTAGAGVCPTPARPGCRLGTRPGASSVRMNASSFAHRMVWKWRYGQQTDVSYFGDPFGATSYALCTYFDRSGAPAQAENVVGPEPCVTAGPTPCWRETGSGFVYRRTDEFNQRTKLLLKAGLDGKASVRFTRTGASFVANPGFTVPLPIIIQLQASDGACWEAVYSTASENSLLGQFRATSD